MFQLFNVHAKKIFIALLFIIIPAFTLYFVRGGNTRENKVVGTVFGKKVTAMQLQQSYKAVYLEAAMRYGQYFKQLVKFLPLEKEAWNRIILLKKADDLSLNVEDKDVKDYILKMFSQDDSKKFDQIMYERFVKENLRMSVSAFEKMIRKSLLASKVKEEVIKDVSVSEAETESFYKNEQNKISFSYVKVEADQFNKDVVVDEDKLLDFFNKNKVKFTIPEMIKVEYLHIKKEQFKDKVEISETNCKEYYENNKDKYLQVKDKKALNEGDLKKEPSLEDSSEPALDDGQNDLKEQYKLFSNVAGEIRVLLEKEKINELCDEYVDKVYREMVDVNSFAKVATKNKITIMTTGFFSANNVPAKLGFSMSPQIRDAFELTLNDFCGPYNHDNGWLIINVIDKKSKRVPEDINEVKEEVTKQYQSNHSPELARKKSFEIRQKIIGLLDKKVFEKAAVELGLKSYVSGLVAINSTNIKGLGVQKGLIKKMFDLKEDEISDVIEISAGRSFLIGQVSKRVVPDMKLYQTKKEEYKDKALAEKKMKSYSEWLEQIKKEANLENYLS